MQQADLILFILDAAKGLDEEDLQLLKLMPQDKTIAIWNKADLPHAALPPLSLPHY